MTIMLPKLASDEYLRLKSKVSSWAITGHYAYQTDDPNEILKLLYVESKSYNRKYNKTRLYQRFCYLRRKTETADFDALVSAIEADQDALPVLRNQYTLHNYILSAKRSIADYLMLLKLELNNERRPYMIKRLYGLFQTARKQDESEVYNG